MKTILIVGGSGFVGSHLALRLRDEYRVVTTHFRHAQRVEGVTDYPLSLNQVDAMKTLLTCVQPEVIIYAAGRHELSWTELPENAKNLELHQVIGPTQLLVNSQIFGSQLIYLSGPHVFDGTHGNYREHDMLIPGTALGKAKLSAENTLKGRALNYLVLRSAPVLGRGPAKNPSTVDQWLRRWGQGQPIEADDSTRHSYVAVSSFADWVARCIEASAAGLKHRALHFGGLSRVTEFDVALELATRLKIAHSLVLRKPKAVVQTKSSAHTTGPSDFSLNITTSIEALKIQPLLLKQSLDLVEQSLLIP